MVAVERGTMRQTNKKTVVSDDIMCLLVRLVKGLESTDKHWIERQLYKDTRNAHTLYGVPRGDEVTERPQLY